MKTTSKKKVAKKPVAKKKATKKPARKVAKKTATKKAAKAPKARKGWAAQFKKADAQFKGRVEAEKQRIKGLTEMHLTQVARETGKVTKVDRDYCKQLGERMLDHKFRDSLEKV